MTKATRGAAKKQNLHLVFGGELAHMGGVDFRDVAGLDIVGIYPSRAEAEAAWKGVAQRTVDNAMTRYFIVDLRELIDPSTKGGRSRRG
ncbi:MAG: DUF4170 domain-containing protein [Hyphomicrobiaceae bacterium]